MGPDDWNLAREAMQRRSMPVPRRGSKGLSAVLHALLREDADRHRLLKDIMAHPGALDAVRDSLAKLTADVARPTADAAPDITIHSASPEVH